jgi:DNA polymerase-1
MRVLAFDLETTGLASYAPDAAIRVLALCDASGGGTAQAWDDVSLLDCGVIESAPILIGHNLAFDVAYYEAQTGRRIGGKLWDTMVAASLLDENGNNSLDAVAERYLGERKMDFNPVGAPITGEFLEYAARDAELAWLLSLRLAEELEEQELTATFNRRMRILRVLIDMHHEGILVDVEQLKIEEIAARETVVWCEQEMEELLAPWLDGSFRDEWQHPWDFNPRSGDQIAIGLALLGVELDEVTPSGKPSTSEAALARVRPTADEQAGRFLDALALHREYAKLVSTYLVPFGDKFLGRDGRVHTTYHLAHGIDYGQEFGTVTGRLSSSNPNLQNISTHKESSQALRRSLLAPPGHLFAEVDYSQVEVRVAAWFSRDEQLLRLFEEGLDFHTHTVALLEGMPYEDVEQLVKTDPVWSVRRTMGKRLSFGLFYGAWPPTIHEQCVAAGIDVSKSEVERYWWGWREQYRGYAAWEQAVHELVGSQSHLTTPFGLVRHFPLEHGWGVKRQQRQGVNFLIQSTAAEICYEAMLLLAAEPGIVPVGTVHDSVLVRYPEDAPSPVDRIEEICVDDVLTSLDNQGIPHLDYLHLAVDVSAGLTAWTK